VQEAMNALNREYVKKTQDLTNELAYRKVIDKLSATLGTAFWHTFVSIFFLFSYFLLHFTFYILLILVMWSPGVEHPALCRHLYYMAHVYMGTYLVSDSFNTLSSTRLVVPRARPRELT
jgi:hypothetical protein